MSQTNVTGKTRNDHQAKYGYLLYQRILQQCKSHLLTVSGPLFQKEVGKSN